MSHKRLGLPGVEEAGLGGAVSGRASENIGAWLAEEALNAQDSCRLVHVHVKGDSPPERGRLADAVQRPMCGQAYAAPARMPRLLRRESAGDRLAVGHDRLGRRAVFRRPLSATEKGAHPGVWIN